MIGDPFVGNVSLARRHGHSGSYQASERLSDVLPIIDIPRSCAAPARGPAYGWSPRAPPRAIRALRAATEGRCDVVGTTGPTNRVQRIRHGKPASGFKTDTESTACSASDRLPSKLSPQALCHGQPKAMSLPTNDRGHYSALQVLGQLSLHARSTIVMLALSARNEAEFTPRQPSHADR
jgi:hypothetical protein